MNKNVTNPGVKYVPYIFKARATSINGVIVWHSNKLINTWLKVKFFFWKPKELNILEKLKKPINIKHKYQEIKIKNDE